MQNLTIHSGQIQDRKAYPNLLGSTMRNEYKHVHELKSFTLIHKWKHPLFYLFRWSYFQLNLFRKNIFVNVILLKRRFSSLT